MTLDILSNNAAAGRVSESLEALGRGEPGTDLESVQSIGQDLARRRATGA